MTERFKVSETLLERAFKVIPGGTQTFSKGVMQYPRGVSPFYAQRAEGARVWDVDGNEFIDFVSALLSVNLGYKDPEVTCAVQAQIEDGVSLSLPMSVEIELAEELVRIVPCAEMVRFGKNGSDATTGAVRVARAYTKRDLIVVCGYHGWHDWYIGSTTRNAGIPKSTINQTLVVPYNDQNRLEDIFRNHRDRIAAVILEPANSIKPEDGWLGEVRNLCRHYGTLLIFDEIITGFRFATGGGQEFFGVTPDLCTLGKGLANGYPLSAVVGRSDIMQTMQEVFFSGTQNSEAVSLAAGLATVRKVVREPVIPKLWALGDRLQLGLSKLISDLEISHIISHSGYPPWIFLNFFSSDTVDLWDIKTLWMQECLDRGILCLGTHNLNYSHSEHDIDRLLAVYSEVFPILKEATSSGDFGRYLKCNPLRPVFKPR